MVTTNTTRSVCGGPMSWLDSPRGGNAFLCFVVAVMFLWLAGTLMFAFSL
jgi:hypothetical protein